MRCILTANSALGKPGAIKSMVSHIHGAISTLTQEICTGSLLWLDSCILLFRSQCLALQTVLLWHSTICLKNIKVLFVWLEVKCVWKKILKLFSVSTGVDPQGSSLGPLVFLITITHLPFTEKLWLCQCLNIYNIQPKLASVAQQQD